MAIKKIIGIYLILSPSGKIYIGQSVDILRRFDTYKKVRYPSAQPKLYASLIKYGPESHLFEIIKECEESLMNFWEAFYIKLYSSFDNYHGMNLKDSAHRGSRLSQETIEKISRGNKGKGRGKGWKHSEDVCKKISIGHMGNKNAQGRIVSEETRQKIRQSLLGKKHTEERRKNISDGHKRNRT